MNNKHHLRIVRDVISLLNDEFKAARIVRAHYEYGIIKQEQVTIDDCYFSAFLRNNKWEIYCSSYTVWGQSYFKELKRDLFKILIQGGVKCKFSFVHPLTVRILMNSNTGIFIRRKN